MLVAFMKVMKTTKITVFQLPAEMAFLSTSI